MKKFIVIVMLLIGFTASSQVSYGIKGGLNYGAAGEYETIAEAGEDAMTFEGKNQKGYHLGGFAQFGLLGIFIQPELMYTSLKTEFDTFDYKLNKVDAPILLGMNVLGPLNIKAGPSFQYILNNEIENSDFEISEVENKITMGYQLGAGVSLGRLKFDARYEGAFKENTAFSEMASENFAIDARPSQWIFSLAYSFN